VEGRVFDNPKDHEILARIILYASEPHDLILDFFAGSCSIAQAVIETNVKHSAKRRFIAVQLPEKCPEDSVAFRKGYADIAAIGKERIRRVLDRFRATSASDQNQPDAALSESEDQPLVDLGFRVFKLSSSNIRPWDAEFDTVELDLLDAIENIKSDRSEDDVLYELLLKYGLDLAIPTETRTIEGRKVTVIGAGALIVCLADAITLEVVSGIAALKEELNPEIMRVVFKDSGFSDDVVKTNAAQILRQAGIDDVKSL